MSQYAAELCTLLIADNFGELYSLIFSYLVQHGRQPLMRIVHNTNLSPRQVKHGLAILIQQQLIFHYTGFEDGVSYYQANWRAAYLLVRSGSILQLTRERLGDYAAKVVSAILSLGHVKISHLESLPELQPTPLRNGSHQHNGVNGDHSLENGDEETMGNGVDDGVNGDTGAYANATGEGTSRLGPTLRELAAYGYIMRVKDVHFQSPSDLLESARRAVKASGETEGLKGKKLDEKIEEKAEIMLQEWMDGTVAYGLIPRNITRGMRRRAANGDSEGPRKRPKLDEAVETDNYDISEDEDDDDGDMTLDSNMVIRINYEQFNVALRSQRLIKLADQETSPVTSQVYEILLSRIELKTRKCRQQDGPVLEGEEGQHYSVPIPLHTIVNDLDPNLDLLSSVAGMSATKPKQNGLENGHGEDDEDEDEDDFDEEDGEGNPQSKTQSRVFQVAQHLSLLASEPYHFSTRRMDSGIITWAVEFRHLARKLRHLEIERLVESRYGTVAVRVLRVLADKGRLDEKRLQEISLMPSKDLRQILARLQSGGFIDLQEVPRDAQRQPSRTIYLWFYDADRVVMMLVEDTYKSMARCLQRLAYERGKLKTLIEKAERSDVKRNMERYLSASDMAALQEWEAKETLLLGEVARLDELVAVLRDY
ncbi:DNA-directed RNA polymerase III subunit RPC3 [Nannizzia gypsea CBS 118893]|uniref:DNA-directed RNA polymerase III subunit RPC3 n=1 Tax=Arthroderma gypseum (strain ATCC MYA-4604 / CBS 118893) TaxID=535722 RepID=E4UTW5_ARTGP|nr:DNA-directed RNA polymerase III subunit RPC3 [Nannizzia gypsea CBS 118893]EFR00771.1 DNA-directed RNA polymerase III subunit RPC3 [Nannizzia gypsea CBS 118893]